VLNYLGGARRTNQGGAVWPVDASLVLTFGDDDLRNEPPHALTPRFSEAKAV